MRILLRKLEIENFRIHENTKIEFKDGINILSGRNGSGKTSVLYAIFVALFPSVKTKDVIGITKEDLIRIGSPSARILLDFDIIKGENVVKCQIEKLLVRGASSKTNLLIIENGTKKRITTTELAERKIMEMLGINHKTFTNSVYVKQGEIKRIITDRNRLSEVILEYLEINKYTNATRNLSSFIRKIENSSREIDAEIQKCSEEIRELELKIRKNEKELEQKRKLLTNKEEEMKKLSTIIETLETLKTRINDLRRSQELLERYRNDIETYEEALSKVKSYRDHQVEKAYEDIKKALQKYNALKN